MEAAKSHLGEFITWVEGGGAACATSIHRPRGHTDQHCGSSSAITAGHARVPVAAHNRHFFQFAN